MPVLVAFVALFTSFPVPAPRNLNFREKRRNLDPGFTLESLPLKVSLVRLGRSAVHVPISRSPRGGLFNESRTVHEV